MNKILFRGFYPDENGITTITLNGKKIKGEWVQGLLPFRNEIRVFTTHKWNDEGEEREYATTEDLRVIPETVGQWVTTDKKGKDIFLGDLVLFEDECPNNYEYHDSTELRVGEVKYDNGEYYVTNTIAVEMDDLRCGDYWECEIFSNIWEIEE